ncbi:hypothetical protein A1D23_07135 [Chelonobacter oris]|nr:hypothetical protein [Chelonobacter oris]
MLVLKIDRRSNIALPPKLPKKIYIYSKTAGTMGQNEKFSFISICYFLKIVPKGWDKMEKNWDNFKN